DRIGRTERKMFALRDEGRGSIVDENVERRRAPDRVHHVVDGGTVTDVAGDGRDLAAGLCPHLSGSRLQPVKLAAADHELCAEREETAPHRGTESRATTGDEDALVPKQTCFKHRLNPPIDTPVIAREAKQSRLFPQDGFWIASLRSR